MFVSDTYLGNQIECERFMATMRNRRIQVIILVPKNEYDLSAADRLAKSAYGAILDIGTIEDLPQKLLKLTNY